MVPFLIAHGRAARIEDGETVAARIAEVRLADDGRRGFLVRYQVDGAERTGYLTADPQHDRVEVVGRELIAPGRLLRLTVWDDGALIVEVAMLAPARRVSMA